MEARPPVLQAPEQVVRVARQSDEDDEFERGVLQATEHLLGRVSLHQLSVERILTEAGTSRARFYRHFSSKWSVVAASLEQAVNELFEAAEPFFSGASTDTPLALLEQVVAAEVAVFHRHRYVLRAAMQYWPSMPDLRQLWVHMHDQLSTALGSLIEEQRTVGRATPGPPAHDLAQALVSAALHGFITAPMIHPDDDTAEERVVPAIAHMWANAIYGSIPPPGATE